MLQINPEIALLRANLRTKAPMLWFILLAVTAVTVGLRAFQGQTPVFSPILLIPFLAVIVIHGKAFFDIYWHSRKLYLQRQERVLLGDTRLLAVEQPTLNKQMLPSHIIVSWRTRISAYTFIYLLGWLIILALCLPFIILLSPPSQVIGLLLCLGFVFVGVPVMGAFFTIWQRRKLSHKAQDQQEEADEEDETAPTDGFSLLTEQFVDVDEESLTLYAFGKGHIDIPWEEARLFCIVSGGNKPKSQRTYALVSENTCAKWVDVPSQSFWPLSRYRPWLPDAQHQQKTQELLQFIVGRTGLPLYDLRRESGI